jgi:phosphoribosyl 1,2-cyclic phosphate phosphodiesterase
MRPSVLLRYHGRVVVIDTSPDFRQQVLRFGVDRVDAILYTHAHADHILGMDDLRPFNYHQAGPIPIYASAPALETIRDTFRYIFNGVESQSSCPQIDANIFDGRAFKLFGMEVQPLPLEHGENGSHGFRFGKLAYLTDHNTISDDVKRQLRGLDVLFLDALRHKPHPTHSTIEESLRVVEELQPKRAFFTHISCRLGRHEETELGLPPNVRLAFDGLEISTDLTD